MSKVYLSLGSNINDRLNYLRLAIKEIESLEDTKVIKCSSIYQTEPWGYKGQDAFLNLVLFIETGMPLLKLMNILKDIETKCGRVKREKWFEREIDIDILFYDDITLKSEQLEIPHPQLHNRRFVLIPMNEIEPEFIHPVFNKSVNKLLDNTVDKSEVKLYKEKL